MPSSSLADKRPKFHSLKCPLQPSWPPWRSCCILRICNICKLPIRQGLNTPCGLVAASQAKEEEASLADDCMRPTLSVASQRPRRHFSLFLLEKKQSGIRCLCGNGLYNEAAVVERPINSAWRLTLPGKSRYVALYKESPAL